MATKAAKLNPLHARHTAAINELKRASDACGSTPAGTWLRRMAGVRRTLAHVYRDASDSHHPDSVEWHGLREAALLLDAHAAANLTAAHLDDLNHKSTRDGAA